jgi:hypothetical protein
MAGSCWILSGGKFKWAVYSKSTMKLPKHFMWVSLILERGREEKAVMLELTLSAAN